MGDQLATTRGRPGCQTEQEVSIIQRIVVVSKYKRVGCYSSSSLASSLYGKVERAKAEREERSKASRPARRRLPRSALTDVRCSSLSSAPQHRSSILRESLSGLWRGDEGLWSWPHSLSNLDSLSSLCSTLSDEWWHHPTPTKVGPRSH